MDSYLPEGFFKLNKEFERKVMPIKSAPVTNVSLGDLDQNFRNADDGGRITKTDLNNLLVKTPSDHVPSVSIDEPAMRVFPKLPTQEFA